MRIKSRGRALTSFASANLNFAPPPKNVDTSRISTKYKSQRRHYERHRREDTWTAACLATKARLLAVVRDHQTNLITLFTRTLLKNTDARRGHEKVGNLDNCVYVKDNRRIVGWKGFRLQMKSVNKTRWQGERQLSRPKQAGNALKYFLDVLVLSCLLHKY